MSFDKPKLPTGFKLRKHHNTKGQRQARTGKTFDQVRKMAKRLGVRFGPKAKP